MTEGRWTKAATRSGVALLAVVGAIARPAAVGQAPSSASQPAPSSSAKAPADKPAETLLAQALTLTEKKEFRGRLPNYYGRVVDEKQRQCIYQIQREYAPRIDFLKGQLAALIAERDKKVAAVLTPQQLNKVEQFRAEAKAKRARAKAAKPQPAANSSG